MKFAQAFKRLENGKAVRRQVWVSPYTKVEMQEPDENSKITSPYLYMTAAYGVVVPWLPSQVDLFATDWEVVGEDPTEGED